MNVWYSHNGERLGTYDGNGGAVWTVDVDCKLCSSAKPLDHIYSKHFFQQSQDSWFLEQLIIRCGCGMCRQESVCIPGSFRRR